MNPLRTAKNGRNRVSQKTVQSLTNSFFLADQDFVGFHLDFERTLKIGGVIKAGNRMRLQPVQNSQNCLCFMVNLPLCRDSQWKNHQLSLSVCPRMKKIPHGLV